MKLISKILNNYALKIVISIAGVLLVQVAHAEVKNDYPLGQRSIMSDRAIAERLSSESKVCLAGMACVGMTVSEASHSDLPMDNSNKSMQLAAADSGSAKNKAPRPGDKIYNTYCVACHASGVAGAPKLGDQSAWAPRIKKGVPLMVLSVKNGMNAMPPKGMCMDCTEKEFVSVVEYMVNAR